MEKDVSEQCSSINRANFDISSIAPTQSAPGDNSEARSGPSERPSSPLACTQEHRQDSTFDLNDFKNKMSHLTQQLIQTLLQLFLDLELDVNLSAFVCGALPEATVCLMQLCLGEQYNEHIRSLRQAHILTAYSQVRALISAFAWRSIFNADLLSHGHFTRHVNFLQDSSRCKKRNNTESL